MDINNETLEGALNTNDAPKAPAQEVAPQMPKEMEIGFHQGALNTLVGERHALTEMISHVEARMQSHIKRLEELGVSAQKKE